MLPVIILKVFILKIPEQTTTTTTLLRSEIKTDLLLLFLRLPNIFSLLIVIKLSAGIEIRPLAQRA